MNDELTQSLDEVLEQQEQWMWEQLGEAAHPLVTGTFSRLRRVFSLIRDEAKRANFVEVVRARIAHATRLAVSAWLATQDLCLATSAFASVFAEARQERHFPLDAWFPAYEQVANILVARNCSLEEACRVYAETCGASYPAVRRHVWRTLRTLATLPLHALMEELLGDEDESAPPCLLLSDDRGRIFVITLPVLEMVFAYTRARPTAS